MGSSSGFLRDFRHPLPERCRVCRKWNWEVAQAVSVGGFDDASGGGHDGETFVERRGANVSEWLGAAGFGQCGGDAIIDGTRIVNQGCAYCIHMHMHEARSRGESEDRVYVLYALRETDTQHFNCAAISKPPY
jgi:hypothetical protein